MYVGPFETDLCVPIGVTEVDVVDNDHKIIFLGIFWEFAHSYANQLVLAEQNNGILMAYNMEVDRVSNKT